VTRRTPHAILTRHFLRRFLETDLISPDADRSQLIALVGATCFCSTVFITVTVSCFKYVAAYYTPGQAALISLDDKTFYIGLSMLVAALLAVSQWDALVIDARDAAILEPIPLRISVIRRAKLSAVARLGAAAALVLNLAPSVIFPLLLLVNQRVSLPGALWLVLTHAAVTMAAAVFGYVAIVALREVLAALSGPRGFARMSDVVQGLLVIALGSALLLLPSVTWRGDGGALAGTAAMSPPAWFLGAYEVVAGNVLVDAPRRPMVPHLIEADRRATAAYRAQRGRFATLAGAAAAALLLAFAAAALAHTWNARRLPQLAPGLPAASRRQWPLFRRFERVLISRDAVVRAGFYFTIAVLWRSRTHRLTLACASAVGLAVAVIALSGLDLGDVVRSGRAAPRLLIAQPLLFGALLIGFRHAVRVPAELSANWGLRQAWRGHTREFLAGTRRAAVVALIIPSLAVVFPLVAFALGPLPALVHAGLGLAGAVAVLEALMATYNKVPFACTYLPDDSMKALGPIYVGMFLLGSSTFARLESAALGVPGGALRMAFGLVALVVIARVASRYGKAAGPVKFDEAPEGTQQLGLHT
jgi:hypothetical protein